jgi:hypothetical protein
MVMRRRTALLLCGFVACKDSQNGPHKQSIEYIPGVEYGNFDPDHVVRVDLEMDEADWEALRFETQSFVTALSGDCMSGPIGMDYTEFQASISMDDQALSPVRIRKKGLLGSQNTKKPSFSINLDEYVDDGELFGTDNLVLNNATQDDSLIRQCLAYWSFAQAGLPAPRCNFAQVTMNGEDLGIYAHVEPVRKSFLRDHFGNDEGDLYEGTLSDFREIYTQTFDPDSDETDEEMAGILSLTELLEDDELNIEALAEHIDIDQFLSFWVMEALTGHWDGYAGNRNNYFIYDDAETDRMVFIPWGADATFVDYGADEYNEWIPASSILAVRFLESEQGAQMFEDRVSEILDTVWDEGAIEAEIDRMETLLEAEIDMDQVEDGIDNVRDYVDQRRDSIQAALPVRAEELTPPYCLQTIGSIDATFSTDWGSSETSWDWSQEGDLDLDMDWYDYNLSPNVGGVVAGEESESASGILAFYFQIDPAEGSYFLPYILFNMEVFEEGAEVDFDHGTIGGWLHYTDQTMGGAFSLAAYLGGGTLRFDELSTGLGGVASGQLSTSVYVWEPYEAR